METTESADIHGTEEVKYEGKKQNWPVLRMVSKADRDGSRNVTQVTLDPDSFAIGRVLMGRISIRNGEKNFVRVIFQFNRFRLGESLPDSVFEFDPPKKTQLVDALPIPGQTGSFLLNQPAPDFDLKTIDGERVHLAELRGHPVLLNFLSPAESVWKAPHFWWQFLEGLCPPNPPGFIAVFCQSG